MGFFTGYTEARVDGLLAGLGNLTARGSTAASREAKRVVQSFIEGRPAHGSCSGSGDERHCGIVSTGHSLMTMTPIADDKMGKSHIFAMRSKADPTRVTFCVPAKAEFDANMKETQRSKDIRAVASALLSKLKTGVGVKTDKEGDRRFIGRKGRARVVFPGQCLQVRIPKSEGFEAELGLEAADELFRELKRQPNAREWKVGKERVRARVNELKAAIASEKREQAKLVRHRIEAAKAVEKDAAKRAKDAEKAAKAAAKEAGVPLTPATAKAARAGEISVRAKTQAIAREAAAQARALKRRIVGP